MNKIHKYKVLIVDDLHPYLFSRLTEQGFECEDAKLIPFKEIEDRIHQFHVMVIRSRFIIDRKLIDKCTELKVIARAGSGLENIDVEYARSKGITCINSPEGSRDTVGEHTVGLLLALQNKILKSALEVRQGKWNRNENWGSEIKNKTIGIIGYGNMGSAFAKKISGFDCRVISYDKYKSDYSDQYTIEVSLHQIYDEADIVSLHIPLTDITRQMVDISFFSRFKKRIIFLNTSRGEIVNTKELAEAIKKNIISGCALDVLEYENKSFEEISGSQNEVLTYLLSCDNVIITPHIAGWSSESYKNHSVILASKIESLIFS